jgi:peptidyl-prolyl cis-trans isomerase D
MFTQATKFEMEAADKGFDKVVGNGSWLLLQQLSRLDENFGSLGIKDLVRWAFEDDTKVGAVKRFEAANVGHVIATVKKYR